MSDTDFPQGELSYESEGLYEFFVRRSTYTDKVEAELMDLLDTFK